MPKLRTLWTTGRAAAGRDPPASVAKCRHFCKQFFAFIFSHVGLIVLVVGYSIGGAFLFQHVEGPFDYKQRTVTKINSSRNMALDDLWNITASLNVFNRDLWMHSVERRLKVFQSELVISIREGGYDGTLASQWTFSGSFLFALTVITTIGYGNIAPKTETGKIATIVYAIFGIPLMLLYLTTIGGVLAQSFRFVYGRFCQCTKKRPLSIQERRAMMLIRSRSMRLNRQRSTPVISATHLPSPSTAATVSTPAGHFFPAHLQPSSPWSLANPLVSGQAAPRYQSEVMAGCGLDVDHNNTTSQPHSSASFSPPMDSAEIPITNPVTSVFEAGRNVTGPSIGARTTVLSNIPEVSSIATPFAPFSSRRFPPDHLYPPDFTTERAFAPTALATAAATIMSPTTAKSATIASALTASPPTPVHVPISLSLVLITIYISAGGVLFSLWEPDWGYLEGSYFCFISLSTIGFGDLVPGHAVDQDLEGSQERLIITSLYLLGGLALIAMCFNLMQEDVIHKVRRFGRNIGIIRDPDLEEEDAYDDEDE